jgi:hypothetical protein
MSTIPYNFVIVAFICQIALIFYILFNARFPFYSLTSQFSIYTLFSQIIPYFLVDYYFFWHFLIIIITQVITLLVLNNKKFIGDYSRNLNLKNSDIYLFLLLILFPLLVSSILTFYSYIVLLIFMVMISKPSRSSYLNFFLLCLIFYQAFTEGFIGGERRLFVILMFLAYLHLVINYKFNLISNMFFIITLPMLIFTLLFQGVYRSRSEHYFDHLLIISKNPKAIMEHIDIGMYLQVFDEVFNGDFRFAVTEHFISGISYERILYMMIPRSYWSDKPLNITSIISSELGFGTRNGSSLVMGLPTEIYINFGLLFPIIVYFFINFFVKMDIYAMQQNIYIRFLYLILLTCFLSIYRGGGETIIGTIMYGVILVFAIIMCVSLVVNLLTYKKPFKI